MEVDDLAIAGSVTNAAFGHLEAESRSAEPDEPGSPDLAIETRFASDPTGCFVAVSEDLPERVTGVLLSVARGSLGWFGPLAVHPTSSERESERHSCRCAWRVGGLAVSG
jgi:hypothetical protein